MPIKTLPFFITLFLGACVNASDTPSKDTPSQTSKAPYISTIASSPDFNHASAYPYRAVFGKSVLHIAIADTPSQHEQGLMNVVLPKNAGMLFVFEAPQHTCFWMKNTPTPLSIAFLDDDFKILQINDMQPFSETLHCTKQAARYAIEARQGWYDKHHVGIGDVVTIMR